MRPWALCVLAPTRLNETMDSLSVGTVARELWVGVAIDDDQLATSRFMAVPNIYFWFPVVDTIEWR